MRYFFPFLLVCFFFSSALGSWEVETADPTYNTGQYASIALDSNDYPHIAYQYYTPSMARELHYTFWNGTNWEYEVIDGNGPGQNSGAYCSLALDEDDIAHFSYYDLNVGALKYATWDDTADTWVCEIVETNDYGPGYFSCLVLDANGYSHIAYMDDGTVDYAYMDASGWHLEVAATSTGYQQYQWISMALDSEEYPHISFHKWIGAELMYTRKSASGWSVETVDNDGSVGTYSSIALTSDDKPLIAYREDNNLYLTRWDGSSWTRETVVAAGNAYSSLELDSLDNPCISYSQEAIGLRYARYNGTDWILETVDNSSSMCGAFSSLAFDSNWQPHIAYQDAQSGTMNLKYAWYDSSSGTFSSTTTNLNSDQLLLSVSPNPATSFIICNVSAPSQNNIELSLYDSMGRQVLNQTSTSSEIVISVEELPDGIYILKADCGEINSTERLVIIR